METHMKNGAVAHWQMLSRDPERIAKFYGALFGWRVSAANGLGYRMVETGGLPGGIWPVPAEAPEGVQLYVQVGDIDGALAKLVELGGTVVMPKQVLPDGDAMALALDPMGRAFGLMTARA
ncbi:MAG TPA: VOC family protein [Rhizomicrobium sp.]|nr:VOC family protein [Rhizomicrobium sp.]